MCIRPILLFQPRKFTTGTTHEFTRRKERKLKFHWSRRKISKFSSNRSASSCRLQCAVCTVQCAVQSELGNQRLRNNDSYRAVSGQCTEIHTRVTVSSYCIRVKDTGFGCRLSSYLDHQEFWSVNCLTIYNYCRSSFLATHLIFIPVHQYFVLHLPPIPVV